MDLQERDITERLRKITGVCVGGGEGIAKKKDVKARTHLISGLYLELARK